MDWIVASYFYLNEWEILFIYMTDIVLFCEIFMASVANLEVSSSFIVTWIVHWDHQYMFYSIFSNESVTLIQISQVTVACSSFYNSFLPFSWYGTTFETAQWISDGRSSNKILLTSAIVSICPNNIMLSFWTFRILEKTLILQLQTLSMIILSLTQE